MDDKFQVKPSRLILDLRDTYEEFRASMAHHEAEHPVDKDTMLETGLEAMMDALAVLDNISEAEWDHIRNGNHNDFPSLGVICDPVEAFHFDLIETVTNSFIRLANTDVIRYPRPCNFDLSIFPFITIHY